MISKYKKNTEMLTTEAANTFLTSPISRMCCCTGQWQRLGLSCLVNKKKLWTVCDKIFLQLTNGLERGTTHSSHRRLRDKQNQMVLKSFLSKESIMKKLQKWQPLQTASQTFHRKVWELWLVSYKGRQAKALQEYEKPYSVKTNHLQPLML